MRFSTHADLSIRILLYLEAQDPARYVSIREMTKSLDAARGTLNHLMPRMVEAGIVESKYGKAGGARLVKSLDEVLVSQVIDVAENHVGWKFAKCESENGCDCFMKGNCTLEPMYKFAASKIIQIFDQFKMSDLQRPANRIAAQRFAEAFAAEQVKASAKGDKDDIYDEVDTE